MTSTLAKLLPYLPIAYLLAVAWPLARTDLKVRRLPNKYTLPALPITLAAHLAASGLTNQWGRFWVALGLGAAAFGLGLLLNLTGRLGMGDVKLATGITWALAWFGAMQPLIWLTISFGLATAVVLFLFAKRKMSMGRSIALGPYLLAGFVIALALSF